MDTHKQLNTKLLPCLSPLSSVAFSLSLSVPQCLIQGLSRPLWINRDTLSAQRRAVINVFSCEPQGWKRQAYHTSSSQMLFSGQETGRHFSFRSCRCFKILQKQFHKKSDASSYPVIQGEVRENKQSRHFHPSFFLFFFSNRPLALEMKLCGEIHSEYFWIQWNSLWPTEKQR